MNEGEDALKKLIVQKLQDQLDEEILATHEDLPFTQLGLDSEGVVELVAYINNTLGLQCSVSVVFDHPSISKLAAHLAASLADPGQANVAPVSSGGRAPGVVASKEARSDRAVAII